MESITITSDGIQFNEYPFEPASIYPDGLLPWQAIREIVPGGMPPEVRTHQGEVLFVPAPQKDVLIEVAHTRGISLVKRVDVWSFILEPFLDTEFDEWMKLFTQRRLEENSISEAYYSQLRLRFTGIMIGYNFETGLWDWAHLGLYDLLSAHKMFRKRLIPADRDFNVVYWEAMDVAERGQLIGSEA